MFRKYMFFGLLVCTLLLTACTQKHDAAESSFEATEIELSTSGDDGQEMPLENVYLNPDGNEFARQFGSFIVDCKEPIVQYWDTGKDVVKFKIHTDKDKGHVFEINGHAVNCFGTHFRQILVEDEYIIVVPGGTDINTFPVYIFDYSGNTLFKTYYLSNTGMVNLGNVTVADNKIIINGTRTTHGPSIVIGMNSLWLEDFSAYSDYLYEDTVYDYGDSFSLPYEVYLDESNADEIKILNPNEKTSAVFEMEYLGDGKFSKLRMTDFRILKMDMPDMQWEEPVEACITGNKLYLKSQDGTSINIEASYPTVHLPDSTVSEKINKVIKDFIDSNYSEYYDLPSVAAVNAIHSKMIYEVPLFDGVKLSIHFSASFTGSGAAQYINDTSFTFDLQTGELIPLSALCGQRELIDAINGYFDRLDENLYPTLFSMYSMEEIRNDFLTRFDPKSKYYERALYNSYYITENELCLFAGHYKGYTFDIVSPLEGDRSFAADIDRILIPEFALSADIRDTAVEFFEAYMMADIETAKALMDSEDNDCLEYFPSTARPFDSVEMWNMELIYEKCIEDSVTTYTLARIDIPLFRKEFGDCIYMCLTLEKRNAGNCGGGDDSRWVVTYYDFEA